MYPKYLAKPKRRIVICFENCLRVWLPATPAYLQP